VKGVFQGAVSLVVVGNFKEIGAMNEQNKGLHSIHMFNK
jgi:hypothetical protein